MLNYKLLLISIFMILFCGCYSGTYTIDNDIGVNVNNGVLLFRDYNLQNGNYYRSEAIQTLNNGNTFYIAGVTYNNSICMCARELIGESTQNLDITVNLYENGNFTGGTIIDNFNRNRNFEDNSTFTIYNDITVVNLGLRLPYELFLKGDKREISESSNEISLVMKKNTTYILKIDNEGISSADLKFIWNWIEQNCD